MARDLSKYQFMGQAFGKRQLVLAVVKQYVLDRPKASFEDLRRAFPRDCFNGEVVASENEIEEKKSSSRDGSDRFFMGSPLELNDGTTAYVSNQWGKGDMPAFINIAGDYNYKVSLISADEDPLVTLFNRYKNDSPRTEWMQSYRKRHEEFVAKLTDAHAVLDESFLNVYWGAIENGLSSVGQGALSKQEFKNVLPDLEQLTRDTFNDPSPDKYDQLISWLTKKVAEKKLSNRKRAVVNRMFATVSPTQYTIVLNPVVLKKTIKLLNGDEYKLGLTRGKNWAETNRKLTEAITEAVECDDPFLVNTFIWEIPKLLGNIAKKEKTEKNMVNALPGQNIILFGPPGTGKTYSTTQRAVELALGDESDDLSRKEVKKAYAELEAEGRITFATFHQSFSYEDFIEGIKPVIDDDSSDVRYEIAKGVFKEIAGRAEKNYRISQLDPETLESTNYFESLNQAFISHVIGRLQNGPVALTPSVSIVDVGDDCFRYRGDSWLNKHGNKVFFTELETSYKNKVNSRKELKQQDGISALAKQHATYQFQLLEMLREFEKTFNYQRASSTGAESVDLEDYVIVIDEINRGNVSAIFGELITLIESDKRIGMENETKAVLPYSKKLFGIPPNLHILATMNTADKSVEALDSALRRRFTFEECGPDYQLLETYNVLYRLFCANDGLSWNNEQWQAMESMFFTFFGVEAEGKRYQVIYDDQPNLEVLTEDVFDGAFKYSGIDLARLLETINTRLELLLDKDHQIGHSYFLGIEKAVDPFVELQLVFRNKIIPLLEEFFFGQPEKIGMVLGKTFVSERKLNNYVKLCAGFDDDLPSYDEKKLYQISMPETIDGFKAVYEA